MFVYFAYLHNNLDKCNKVVAIFFSGNKKEKRKKKARYYDSDIHKYEPYLYRNINILKHILVSKIYPIIFVVASIKKHKISNLKYLL